ncbi:MAG: choice-of-anchor B family protein, partial [Sphingobacteriales bacterium]
DIWGYAANGREYAILGSTWGTHFVDVTDPTAPVEVGAYAGAYQFGNNSISWRDYKTYSHFVYAVADANNGNSLQIFDVSGLPNSVSKVYDSQNLSASAHTVALEGDRLYLVNNKRNGSLKAIDIFSLANPENPVFVASVHTPFFNQMHAIHVRNNIAYCSYGYGGLYIMDLTNPTAPTVISSITNYPGSGYNHTAWTSGDDKTMIMTDEVPAGLPVKVYNIQDKANPVYVTSFASNQYATPHNTFMIDNYAILSYYKDGVQVYDLADPANPVRIGYYDTYPNNTSSQASYNQPSAYDGAWGVYPFLPSGNILVSDITYGLFVISPPYTVTSAPAGNIPAQVKVFPNP